MEVSPAGGCCQAGFGSGSEAAFVQAPPHGRHPVSEHCLTRPDLGVASLVCLFRKKEQMTALSPGFWQRTIEGTGSQGKTNAGTTAAVPRKEKLAGDGEGTLRVPVSEATASLRSPGTRPERQATMGHWVLFLSPGCFGGMDIVVAFSRGGVCRDSAGRGRRR